jgi:hypothetical protein
MMRGIFASLSGFSSNALETYDNDLNPSDTYDLTPPCLSGITVDMCVNIWKYLS